MTTNNIIFKYEPTAMESPSPEQPQPEQVSDGPGVDWSRIYTTTFNQTIPNDFNLLIKSETDQVLNDAITSMFGKKEQSNKVNYELDWNFIKDMGARMAKNKGKYEPYNWKKPMDVEMLKQALFRHVLEVMNDNFNDEEEFDHLPAIALNAMMIYHQIKKDL